MIEDALLAQAESNPLYVWIAIIAAAVYFVGRFMKANREEEERKRQHEQAMAEAREKEQAVAEIAVKLRSELDKVEALKEAAARATHCKKALALLRETDQYYPVNEAVIENYDRLKARLEVMPKVFPVIDYVEKAYKARFKGSTTQELNALTDALYAVQTGQVTNEDFIRAEVFPEGAFGEIVQIEDLANRARELGWEGPADGSTI